MPDDIAEGLGNCFSLRCIVVSFCHVTTYSTYFPGWLRGLAAEHWSLSGELSLSCAWPAADGWPLMCVPSTVDHPRQLSFPLSGR